MNVIAVTGTPGTGKTAIAKKLSLLTHYTYIDGSDVIKRAHLGREFDEKRKVPVVDPSEFSREMLKIIVSEAEKGKKGVIIDSLIAHFLPYKAVKCCIVTVCELKTLKKRLTSRAYNSRKIRENLDAEIFDTILNEARDNRHNIIIVDTTNNPGKKQLKSLIFNAIPL